jgi:hypothetical protein
MLAVFTFPDGLVDVQKTVDVFMETRGIKKRGPDGNEVG